jgi:hypothetical protein
VARSCCGSCEDKHHPSQIGIDYAIWLVDHDAFCRDIGRTSRLHVRKESDEATTTLPPTPYHDSTRFHDELPGQASGQTSSSWDDLHLYPPQLNICTSGAVLSSS